MTFASGGQIQAIDITAFFKKLIGRSTFLSHRLSLRITLRIPNSVPKMSHKQVRILSITILNDPVTTGQFNSDSQNFFVFKNNEWLAGDFNLNTISKFISTNLALIESQISASKHHASGGMLKLVSK